MHHTPNLLGGLSAKGCFATARTNCGGDFLNENMLAVNVEYFIDSFSARLCKTAYMAFEHIYFMFDGFQTSFEWSE